MKKRLLVLFATAILVVSCFAMFACGDATPPAKAEDKLPNLSILYENDASLKNTYTMIAVNPEATFVSATSGQPLTAGSVSINTAGADAFINWLSLAATQNLIKNFGVDKFGEALFYLLDGAEVSTATIPQATDATKVIKISTTTSVNDSGLLGYLEPLFENAYGYDLQIASAGTGAAINAAKYGNADMILVHSKSSEVDFVNDANKYARKVDGFTGDATNAERISFMYNFFVLVGPKADPANAKTAATVKDAFAAIASGEHKFISRGDKSGTHNKEWTLWPASVGITSNDVSKIPTTISGWYVSAGQGMGACLTMANEQGAYCLTDKATFLNYKNFIEA